MAKPSPMQWIPSGGVLAAAIGAGLLAAILINLYAGNIRSQYEMGSQPFYVLTDDVAAGNQIQERNLKAIQIPKPLLPAFAQAVTADDRGRMTVVAKKAPRLLKKDTFLWFPDFIESDITKVAKFPPGYEMITIRIDPNASLGAQLQPGSYVNVRGLFNIGSDPRNPTYKPYDILKNVQVRALGGSTTAPEKGRSYDNIQIVIPSSQARLMLEVAKMQQSGYFTVGVVEVPEGVASEPKIEKDVLELINRPRTAAPAPGAAAPAVGAATSAPPPPPEPAAPPVPVMP
jgi:Flp pilus assembly protein CpaB